ncbi:hypothetical protein [Burkholderia glumae]|uniref:hypothetical protein n=1 Tax=Burkholderia glumae TaxID=337 RepID=UPI002150E746|nr:hypothetical protein [Burkholderia glumae]
MFVSHEPRLRCPRDFSRTVGTPLGERHVKKLDLFVSLPLAFDEIGAPEDLRLRGQFKNPAQLV